MRTLGRRVAVVAAVTGSLVMVGSALASASPVAVSEIGTGDGRSTAWQDCEVKVGTDGSEWMVFSADAPCTIFYAGGGNDYIFGGPGDDFVFGEGGDDKIAGGGGDDTIWGGQGDDFLVGEAGADQIWGMNGDDVVDVRDNSTSDYANGGAGRDCSSIDNGEDAWSGFEHVYIDTPPHLEACEGWN